MLTLIVLVVLVALLVAAWRQFDLARSAWTRLVLVAFGAGLVATLGLYLAWTIPSLGMEPAWLLPISDVLLLFPLVAVFGTNTRLLSVLGPVLMAVELGVLILLIMSAVRVAMRTRRPAP